MHDTGELPPDGPAPQAGPPQARAPQVLPADDLDDQADRLSSTRRLVICVIVAFFLVVPFFSRPRPTLAQVAFLAPATVILIVVFSRIVMAPGPPRRDRAATAWVVVIVALGLSILIVGGLNWVGAIFIAAAGAGRLAQSSRAAVVGAACCAVGTLGVGLYHGANYGSLELSLGPVLAAFFAYSSARRAELVAKLRATRAELARMAVADERLRIARDLHDLLGHSLSLITLKAELAGRLIGADPDRAAREVSDLEAVARRSLGEVRAAVTSYRQPTLAAQLAEARQMLAAAGMEVQVHAPASTDLAPEAEALLAWTVREGATNVVRHSGARTVTITVTAGADEVTAEVADDGVGPAWSSASSASRSRPPGPGNDGGGQHGSGLTGLTERARDLGAEISAGEGRGGKGFRLLVRVPAGRFSVR